MEADISLLEGRQDPPLGASAERGHLVAAVAAHKSGAIEALFDTYGTLAFTLAYRMLGDRGAAEDVTQEAFIRVWRYSASYDPLRSSERSWLLSIVRNRCIDRLRESQSRPQVAGELSLENQPAGSDTWRDVARALTAEQVRRALTELPDEQRATIELTYFHGLTQQEVAVRMDVPLGTVKGRIRLGLGRLRDLIPASEAEV